MSEQELEQLRMFFLRLLRRCEELLGEKLPGISGELEKPKPDPKQLKSKGWEVILLWAALKLPEDDVVDEVCCPEAGNREVGKKTPDICLRTRTKRLYLEAAYVNKPKTEALNAADSRPDLTKLPVLGQIASYYGEQERLNTIGSQNADMRRPAAFRLCSTIPAPVSRSRAQTR